MTSKHMAQCAILLAAYMGVLDSFIVAIALPTIQRSLGASAAELQLIVIAYIVTYAGSLIVGGRLGDRFGHRTLFLVGVLGFGAASLLCATAGAPQSLIAMRALQGICAGLMLPQVLALIRTIFAEDRERLGAMTAYAAVLGLGAMTGQLVGGVIIAFFPDILSWRGVFLVNVPLAILSFAVGWRTLPRVEPASRAAIDFWSAILQTAGVAALLSGAVFSIQRAISAQISAALAALGLLLIAMFFQRQHSLGKSGGLPLMPPLLLADPTFRLGLAAVVAYYVSACLQVVITYALQRRSHLSTVSIGLVFLPYGATFAIASLNARALIERFGRSIVWRSLMLSILPLLLMGVSMSAGGASTPFALSAVFLVMGLIQGVIAGPMLNIVLGRIPVNAAGVGSGILLTTIQFTNAAGVALIGGAFFKLLSVWPDAPNSAAAGAIYLCVPFVIASGLMIRSLSSERAGASASVASAGAGASGAKD